MLKRVGEVLEDTGVWPVTWPVRLWIVEPVGDAGNWGQRYYPYRLLAHQIRVVEETDAWQAFGVGGREVLDIIKHQIPERAPRWAADWDANGMREWRRTWELCGGRNSNSGSWARSIATATTRSRRESAAQRWSERLAGGTVDQVLGGVDVGSAAISYACSQAADLAIAAQHQSRFDAYVLDTLRGVDLDSAVPAVAV